MVQQTVRRNTTRVGRAIVAVVICQLMLQVDSVIVTVALPDIRQDLGLDPVGLSWVVSAYALAFAGLLLVSGRVGSLIGPRRALLIGVVIFVLASAAGGAAPSGELLIAARAVQGAGAALAGPAVLVLITVNTAEGPARMRGMSGYVIASSAGAAVGLVAGGVLTLTLGWRWVMYVNVPIGLAVIIGTLLFTVEGDRVRGRVDYPGAALSALAMVALVFGLTRAGDSGWLDPRVIVALALAVAAVVAVIFVERRSTDPVVPLPLLRGRAGLPYLTALLMAATLIGFFTFSVLLLQEVRGLNALETGLAYLPWAAAVIIGGRLVPGLLGRIGSRATLATGVVAAIVGVTAVALLGPTAPLWLGVLLPCFVLGFGPALVFTTVTNRVLAAAGERHSGAAAALLQSMQQLGAAVGVAILATVYAGRSATGAEPAITAALLVAAAIGLVLLVLVLSPDRGRSGRTAAE